MSSLIAKGKPDSAVAVSDDPHIIESFLSLAELHLVILVLFDVCFGMVTVQYE